MLTKSETIRARVSPAVKAAAESVFEKLGLSATDAITMFYRQVALHKGIPFEIKIPNAKTQAAMRAFEKDKKKLKSYRTAKEMLDAVLGEGKW